MSAQRYQFNMYIDGKFHSQVDCLPCGRNWIKRRRKRLASRRSLVAHAAALPTIIDYSPR